MQPAGPRAPLLCGIEGARAERPYVDAAADISGEIVETDDTKLLVAVEHHDSVGCGRSLVGHVAPGHDQPAILVQCDTADTAPMLHDGRDPARSFEAVDTTVQDVTEDEPARRIPDGTFDQPVP